MSAEEVNNNVDANMNGGSKIEQPTITLPTLDGIKIHSDKLNMDFTVYIQDQTIKSQQRCYIMTVHDLGCDCKFHE